MKLNSIQRNSFFVCSFYGVDVDEKDDTDYLKEIFSKIFLVGENIVFIGLREQTLTPLEDLKYLKNHISDYFGKTGLLYSDYNIGKKNIANCVGIVEYNSDVEKFIFDLWNYYNYLVFFPLDKGKSLSEEEALLLVSKNQNNHCLILDKYSSLLFNKNEDGNAVDFVCKV